MPTENALAGEKSPYLLQHKNNPVDWLPWGAQAFAQAASEDKPVFLSIGYSTCHWCHVMAHETFENPEIAALMNRAFVNVKVDREERPDVDRVYMAFVQATTGGGGWPMSVWLTPEGHPFFGGTYFPPEDRHGHAGFPRVAGQIDHLWRRDRARIVSGAGRVFEGLREASAGQGAGGRLRPEWIEGAEEAFRRIYDPQGKGFGGAPKFPRPCTLNFLLRRGETARRMAIETLRAMSLGGTHDHLGGGFHRYSVDASWRVPHFEKMLYDQAQIAVSLLEAWQITGDPFFEATARSTLDYVLREMSHGEGGFFSAEDADSTVAHGSPEHAEGAFYVWEKREIDGTLGREAAGEFCEHFGVLAEGNAPEGTDPHGEFVGKNILWSQGGTEPRSLRESREILFALRSLRPSPHRDEKILTAWNGLMISAFARAGAAWREPRYLDAASRAAGFVLGQMQEGGDLLRSWRDGPSRTGGFAEDYAFFIQGLLDLYGAEFDTHRLKSALRLQLRQDELFWDGHSYFSNRAGDPLLPVRMKDDYDGAEPSANSVSALNLLRLARLTHDPSLESMAGSILSAHSESLDRSPAALPQMLVALDLALSPTSTEVVAGTRSEADAFLAGAARAFRPRVSTILLDSPDARAFFGKNSPALSAMLPGPDGSLLYRCENFVCGAPERLPVQ